MGLSGIFEKEQKHRFAIWLCLLQTQEGQSKEVFKKG